MWFGKRAFDFLLALIGLILLFPFFLIISFAILLTDFGPIFFKQVRIGQNGRIFKIIKFRTMMTDEEKKDVLLTAQNDSRITKIGKLLRATKLDELPQLFNVLIGDMSFVGPRPEVKKYVDLLPITDKQNILFLKPGITDMASIEFYNEAKLLSASENPEKLYIENILPQKVKLSLSYKDNASFVTDVKIICKTLHKIL